MKYIRTEYKIFRVENIGYAGQVYYCKGFLSKTTPVQEYQIIAKADTIEELIDWYELVGDDGTILYYNCADFRALKDKILNNKAWIGIYGCIKIKLPSGAFRLEPVAVIKEGGESVLI